MNQTSPSNNNVITDRHIIQDDCIAGDPAVLTNRNPANAEFKWGDVKLILPKLVFVVMIINFYTFSDERVVADFDSTLACDATVVVKEYVVAD